MFSNISDTIFGQGIEGNIKRKEILHKIYGDNIAIPPIAIERLRLKVSQLLIENNQLRKKLEEIECGK